MVKLVAFRFSNIWYLLAVDSGTDDDDDDDDERGGG